MKTLCIVLLATAACAGTKRSVDTYRADTRKALDTRTGKIAVCYDQALAKDTALGATVTIDFVVERKTGKFTQAHVDPTNANAPEAVVTCILAAMEGLALDPPDRNEGHATFIYDLRPAS